jgi:hypothetical protein
MADDDRRTTIDGDQITQHTVSPEELRETGTPQVGQTPVYKENPSGTPDEFKWVGCDFAQTVTVAKEGGDYTTIQDAIDSITDASIAKLYVILVYPGTYTENIILKSFVSLIGTSGTHTSIAGTIVFPDDALNLAEIRNIDIQWTYSTAGSLETVISIPNCALIIFDAVRLAIDSTTNDSQVCMLNIQGGTVLFISSRILLDHTGTSASSNTINLININGSGTIEFNNNSINVNYDDEVDNVRFINENSSADISATFRSNVIFMTLGHDSYSGLARIFRIRGTASDKIFHNNFFSLKATGGSVTGTADCISTNTDAGGAVIRLFANQLEVDGFTDNDGFHIASGDTVINRNTAVHATSPFVGSGNKDYLPRNEYDSSESSSTTTSTSLQDKISLTIVPGASSEVWRIHASFEVRGNTADMYVRARLRDTTNNDTLFENWEHIHSVVVDEEIQISGFEQLTITEDTTFVIQWQSNNGANTASIRKARIWAERVS